LLSDRCAPTDVVGFDPFLVRREVGETGVRVDSLSLEPLILIPSVQDCLVHKAELAVA
jgi:hypothetical protein